MKRKPRRNQQPCNIGLFDMNAQSQLDLDDMMSSSVVDAGHRATTR